MRVTADPPMAPSLAATAEWRPMAFSDGPAAQVRDPLYEPLWAGRRVLVDVSPEGMRVRGFELGPAAARELEPALAASRAGELVLDGYLTPAPLDRAPIAEAAPGRAGISGRQLLRQFFVGGLGQGSSRPPAARDPAPIPALPDDAAIGFVATDLLWLDGEALLHLPLGERKRLLEAVLVEGPLVRRIVPVPAPAERWFGRWRAFGFREIAVKGINSRYAPGGVSEEWAIQPIPRT